MAEREGKIHARMARMNKKKNMQELVKRQIVCRNDRKKLKKQNHAGMLGID